MDCPRAVTFLGKKKQEIDVILATKWSKWPKQSEDLQHLEQQYLEEQQLLEQQLAEYQLLAQQLTEQKKRLEKQVHLEKQGRSHMEQQHLAKNQQHLELQQSLEQRVLDLSNNLELANSQIKALPSIICAAKAADGFIVGVRGCMEHEAAESERG